MLFKKLLISFLSLMLILSVAGGLSPVFADQEDVVKIGGTVRETH